MTDIIFFVLGIYVLYKRRLSITKKIIVQGERAKILGTLYLLPFVSAVCMGIWYGITAIEQNFWYTVIVANFFLVVALGVTLYFALDERKRSKTTSLN